jgi:hypothetical protein
LSAANWESCTGHSLAYLGLTLMENRSGLIVETRVTLADGYGARDAALLMLNELPGGRVTLGGDKGTTIPSVTRHVATQPVTSSHLTFPNPVCTFKGCRLSSCTYA